MARQDIIIGVAAGVAIAALAPLAILVAVGSARLPMSRALARSGQVLGDKAREIFAEFQEIAEDLVVEMRAAHTTEVVSGTAAAATANGSGAASPDISTPS